MATANAASRLPTFWSRRMAEWSILVFVVLVVLYVLGRKAQEVQGMTELAAVRSTLGALRTAMVVEHLRSQVQDGGKPRLAARNPFLHLQHLPLNYAGERSMDNALDSSPGTWFFDPDCTCIGYRLLHPQWLSHPTDAQILGWRVQDNAPAVQTLQALAPYRWFDQVVH